jgi:hypothetical protein
MTRPSRPAAAPRRPRRRGARGQLAGSSSSAQPLGEPIATLKTILRLEAIRLAALHERAEARALADPVTGTLPVKVVMAHLGRLGRHREDVATLALPLAEDARPVAPAPPGVRNDPGQASGRVGPKVDRPKRRRQGKATTAPTFGHPRLAATAGGAAPHDFDKTNPPRARAEIPDESGAPAAEGPARAEPANLALLGLAMLML